MALNQQPHTDRTGPADPGSDSTDLGSVLSQITACGVIAVDSDRNVLAFNRVAESITGLGAAEAASLNDLPTGLRGLLSEALLDGKVSCNGEVNLSDRQDQNRKVQVSVSPLRCARGNVRGVLALLHDLSPATAALRKIRRLDQLASIGTLSAGMAHEIKNALVAIKTFVDLLLQQNKDAELADVVGRELRRVEALASQMLRFAGPGKPELTQVSAHQVLDQSLFLVQTQLEGRKIHLTRAYEARPAFARGDAYQLEQAFLNLLLNAIEAMGPDGRLRVATDIVTRGSADGNGPLAPASQWLRIRIEDSGMGVPEEDRQRLFEPFFTTKSNGTGLGLAITRRIVQEHQGTISFETEVNQGTTFSILLPLAAAVC